MKAAAVMVILLLGLASAAQGATLMVGPSGSPYTSIQDAVDHAAAGDTIQLEPGRYSGPVVISSSLILRGSGREVCTLVAESTGVGLAIEGDRVVVQGLTVTGEGTSTGIHITSDRVEIKDIEVTGGGTGIILEGSSGSRLTGIGIRGSGGYGIALRMTGETIITRNTLSANAGGGLYIDGDSQGNAIYLNDFENVQNVVVEDVGNTWNSPGAMAYIYDGIARYGIMGNHWSDYPGADVNADGIGDSPYLIEPKKGKGALKNPKAGENDLYPLIERWEGLFPATTPLPVTSPTPSPTATQTTEIPSPTTVPPTGTTMPEGGNPVTPEREWSFLPVFGLLLLLGISGGAWYLVHRKDTRNHENRESPLSEAPPQASSTDTVIHRELPVLPEEGVRNLHFPPELQDRYTQVVYVGKGGIARVYKALRKSDGRTVAVKIPVSFDEATGKAFMKEIRVWEDLRHPNIVEVTAVNILPIPYVEMEYLERSLDRCRKPMALPVAIRIMQGIAEGLSYAHHRGVIHRDLKPHNILLGDNLTPKIADWGLSRGLSDDTAASVSGYSLPYASPEQISPRQFGSTGPWTDLYQLGVIMYELIFGVLPFGGEGLYETGTAILSAPPAPAVVPAEVTPILPVILRCLEKEPSARYQSAEEFLDDLARHFGS